jgi:polycomb protein EED
VYLQPVLYNSLTWSQAKNGDPLLCVAGDVSHQIKVFNITTKELVAVRQLLSTPP